MNLASKKHPGVVLILCSWASWVRAGMDLKLGFLHKAVYFDPIEIVTGTEAVYDDEQAQIVDGIIAAMTLEQRRAEQQAIVYKYLSGLPNEHIAQKINRCRLKKHRINSDAVRNRILPAAHNFLDGRFRSYEILKPLYVEAEERVI